MIGIANEQFFEVNSYIGLFLNFELTYISNDTCALKSVTTTSKTILKFFFLVGIIVAWIFVFVFLCVLKEVIRDNRGRVEKLGLKLIAGLLEIVKYTYLGFTSIIFYSLVCTPVAGNQVWFYDASVQCYSKWQVVMLIFGLTFILPYPFLFYFGAKYIRRKHLSGYWFMVASLFPLPALVYWAFVTLQRERKKYDTANLGKIESAIYAGLTRGFR